MHMFETSGMTYYHFVACRKLRINYDLYPNDIFTTIESFLELRPPTFAYKQDITVTPQWVLWRLKSPPYRLFPQPFQTHIIENIKAPRHWAVTGGFPQQMAIMIFIAYDFITTYCWCFFICFILWTFSAVYWEYWFVIIIRQSYLNYEIHHKLGNGRSMFHTINDRRREIIYVQRTSKMYIQNRFLTNLRLKVQEAIKIYNRCKHK